jgi:DNA-binding MarR family transcriptional regulator
VTPCTTRWRNRISLTPAGAELVAEVEADAGRSQRELLRPLPAREQEQLVELLRRVLESHDDERLSDVPAPATG